MKIISNVLVSLFIFLCNNYVYSDCNSFKGSSNNLVFQDKEGHKYEIFNQCKDITYDKYFRDAEDRKCDRNKYNIKKVMILKNPADYVIYNMKMNKIMNKKKFQEESLEDNIRVKEFSILDTYMKNNNMK